ncbi:MAG: type II secretion system protein M [Pseudomonadota bacterium]
MTAWWFDLSSRERVMIMIGGAVLVLALFLIMIVRPLNDYRERSIAEYDRAVSTHKQVTLAAAAPQDDALDAATLRSILTSTANANGIIINRISSQENALDVSVAGTRTSRLYGWIAVLEEQHNVMVQDAQLRPANEGGVTARLTLVSGGGL